MVATLIPKFYVHGTVHHLLILNKPTRSNWAVTFITVLLDHSTCFGCLLHSSSGAQLYMQPLAQVTPRITAFLRGRVYCTS